mmetsp:Transcript_58005/g.173116  ORF Transcript_58005/g.173116 Transcript_58005/m.173116 type:complete len:97 (-) Transcript_58005:174-464(-)
MITTRSCPYVVELTAELGLQPKNRPGVFESCNCAYGGDVSNHRSFGGTIKGARGGHPDVRIDGAPGGTVAAADPAAPSRAAPPAFGAAVAQAEHTA